MRSEHIGYRAFNFVGRDAFHVASIRWWTRMRAFELERNVACRSIQRTQIFSRAQIVE
jgi:hypothetical protein